jgi:hypothetical protein
MRRNEMAMIKRKSRPSCHFLVALFCAILFSTLHLIAATVDKGSLHFTYNERGIFGLSSKDDPFAANVTSPQQPLSLSVHYATADGVWKTNRNIYKLNDSAQPNSFQYSSTDTNSPLRLSQTFTTDGKVLDWSIELLNPSAAAMTIGDLGIDIPSVGPTGENPAQIFEHGFVKHQFISGNGSFIYFVRASGDGPFSDRHRASPAPSWNILAAVDVVADGGGESVFIHSGPDRWQTKSAAPGASPILRSRLGPGSKTRQSCNTAFASNSPNLMTRCATFSSRKVSFDIRAVPGMTVPTDLPARFSLRTKAKIDSIGAEFPSQHENHQELPDPMKRYVRLRSLIQKTRRKQTDHQSRRRTAKPISNTSSPNRSRR